MNDQKINIAIDGPAGAGKSTVAKKIADELNYVYVDTGAMYRAITWDALQSRVDVHNEEQLMNRIETFELELIPRSNGQKVQLNGKDITEQIRQRDVTNHVSFVASHEKVRAAMVKLQQKMASKKGVVMDGRDIGTAVLPNAEVKIFLNATLEERARRRYEELKAKGIEQSLEQLTKEMKLRDERDSTREFAPLRKAEDAISVDTTGLSIDEVAERIISIAKQKMA